MKCYVEALIGLLLASGVAFSADGTKPLYENNFEKTEVGKLPEGFLVLDGGFAVKEESGNRFLELPGAPLDSFGVIFGPAENSDIVVTARIQGTSKGRRFPTFGVGLNGQGGYKLQVSPGKKALDLYKGDEIIASVPFAWESGMWTDVKLQIRKISDTEWRIEGKAWAKKDFEPKEWMVRYAEKFEPPRGRPSIWGNPFAGTPIRFDDLVVTGVGGKP